MDTRSRGDGSQDQVNAWPSTQNTTGWANSLAPNIKVPAANIKVKMDYIGGGFGSKFSADAWGLVAANLSKKAGGAPVKLYLERAPEQMIGGNRPSAFAKIKIGGKKDGTITAWQSASWGTGGFGAVNGPAQPYVYVNIPNIRRVHTNVGINAGPQRAWRAPGNQQASFLTCAAFEDFAAKIGMDPLEVFKKNAPYTVPARTDTVPFPVGQSRPVGGVEEVVEAARHEHRGADQAGLGHRRRHVERRRPCQPVPDGHQSGRFGLGRDQHAGYRNRHAHRHHPGGCGDVWVSQMNQVKLTIGDNSLPPDNASGGSTTVGGVSSFQPQVLDERAGEAV